MSTGAEGRDLRAHISDIAADGGTERVVKSVSMRVARVRMSVTWAAKRRI